MSFSESFFVMEESKFIQNSFNERRSLLEVKDGKEMKKIRVKKIKEWNPEAGKRDRPEKDWRLIMECTKDISCEECNEWNKRLIKKRERESRKGEHNEHRKLS